MTPGKDSTLRHSISRMLPMVLLMILGLSWAIRLLAIKVASEKAATPADVALVATIGIVCILTLTNIMRSKFPPLKRDHLRFYAIAGLLGFALPFLVEISVAPHLSASTFVMIVTSAPIWTVFLSTVFRLEPNNWYRITGIIIGFGATALVIIGLETGASNAADLAQPIWIAAAFIIPILYAAYVLYTAAAWPVGIDSLQVALGQAVVGLLAFAIFWLTFSEHNWPARLSAFDWSIVAIVLSEILALVLFFRLARSQGGSFATQANYIAVVSGTLIGAVYFSQSLNWLIFAGIASLIIALWLSGKSVARTAS